MKIDVIGDIHGCYEELIELFSKLEYQWNNGIPVHPYNRIPVFLGDLMDRGPNSLGVIELVYQLVIVNHKGKYIPGNHCNKLYRFFSWKPC
ncbi:protein phosphatase [Salinibacillus kushneri]|uniref:Protein phosphatase n=1 Tax=Salinibacillus kushneri TaxID=237682 RepID=A0A1I0J175_9BACI|nr:protein phosphatase [Salinibacillus kushneri]